jgi:hypothetical protein
MEMVDIYLMMAVIMKVKFVIIQLKELANTLIRNKIIYIQDNGLILYLVVKDNKSGLNKKVHIRDNFLMGLNMEKEFISLLINHYIKEYLKMINFMVKANLQLWIKMVITKVTIKEGFLKEKWKVSEYSLGKMDLGMKENM